MSTLVANYRFDTIDPLVDSVGSYTLLAATSSGMTGIGHINDATYGTVANFSGLGGKILSSSSHAAVTGDSPRAFSFWVRRDLVSASQEFVFHNGGITVNFFHGYFSDNNDSEFTLRIGANYITATTSPPAFTAATWVHIAVSFDGTTGSIYVNGVFETSGSITNVMDPLHLATFSIGFKDNVADGFNGRMSDFKIYDDAIDANTVSQLSAGGPNYVPEIVITAYTHLMDIEWLEVTGASTYHLSSSRDSNPEEGLTMTTGLSYVATNLVPGSSYEFRMYTDLDLISAVYTETSVTPTVDSTSVDNLMMRLGNDLTLLTVNAVEQVDSFLGTVLTTGDPVNTIVGITTFVKNAETVTLPHTPKEIVFTPFDQTSGSGQVVSIVLPDFSTAVISYDDNRNEVVYGDSNYAIGTSFISGGLKVTPKNI